MASRMVIVESPAKAKTIGKYLGKDYFVASSKGHVRDLPSKKLSVDVEDGFKPTYKIMKSRKDAVKKLKKQAKKAEAVYLATDLDREGEAIAWHLKEALEVPQDKALRVTFSEITRNSVRTAFEKPRKIDLDKVNAQQARRILDRIVGYKLSPLLWQKVARRLSAGRVQSVAVRILCEREKEIADFEPVEYWRVAAELAPADSKQKKKDGFEAELKKIAGKKAKLGDEKVTTDLVERIKSEPFTVTDITTKKTSPGPRPPFITSTLQQRASTQLRFSTRKTMTVAQRLYEGVELGSEGSTGLITYMRTDSVHISDEAMDNCRAQVKKDFGEEYLAKKPRRFKSGKRAQEAHEAVRPTYVDKRPDDIKEYLSRDQYRLYKLIWERFVATQMAKAKVEITDVSVTAGDALFAAKGRRVIFDGYMKLTPGSSKEQFLPKLVNGQELELLKLTPSQHFTEPPPRYTEASLVRVLEKKGLGRPSTYSAIISKIQKRGYVKQEKRKFRATDLGMIVNERLVGSFPDIIQAEFTSEMEDELDKIEEQHLDWVEVLDKFYKMFSADLERAKEEMEKFSEESEQVCDKCGKPMMVKLSTSGKFLACSGFPECKNTKPLTEDGRERPKPVETEHVCDKCGGKMVIRSGRRGKFLGCSEYPECRNTLNIDSEGNPVKPKETGEECEKCGSPMVIKRGRRGPFIACSGFPKCRNTKPMPDELRSKPQKTDAKCEECGKPMLLRTGRTGKFLACSGYPKCKATASLPSNVKVLSTDDDDETDAEAGGDQGKAPSESDGTGDAG